jgi:hypothetical protein
MSLWDKLTPYLNQKGIDIHLYTELLLLIPLDNMIQMDKLEELMTSPDNTIPTDKAITLRTQMDNKILLYTVNNLLNFEDNNTGLDRE